MTEYILFGTTGKALLRGTQADMLAWAKRVPGSRVEGGVE